MLNSTSPSVLGWLCPNQYFSNALLEVSDGIHSKCADYKVLVCEYRYFTIFTTPNVEALPLSKVMTALDCTLLAGPKTKPLRWLLWHCHTTSHDAFHLPWGKCNVKSDKIQTFHDFREKHHVSKTRTNLNQRALQISSSTSQHANLNETWILRPHFSNEKQSDSCLKTQLSLFHLLLQKPPNSADHCSHMARCTSSCNTKASIFCS